MPNASLDDFAGGGDGGGERPAAEAAAVAGDASGSVDFVDTADYRFPDADGSVELAVTQVDYTVEGRGPDERPILHVFGRDDDREVEHVRVHGFRPYFYAPLENFEGVDDPTAPVTEADLADPRLETDGLTGVETYADRRTAGADIEDDRDDERVVVYESIRGRRLAKVFGRTPRDVGQARDEFDHYEADILFPNRLLIDKDVRSGVRVPDRRADDGAVDVPHQELEPVGMDVEPRVNTFDIEVDDRSGFPEDGEEEIVCLSAHDSYRDEYVVWLSQPPSDATAPDSLADHEPLDPEAGHEVRSFEREEAMLADFLDYIEETDPCILTGWNFTDFDAPYLLDRLEVLGGEGDVDPDRLSRVDEVWRSDWQGPNVKGRVVFDLLYAYQRTQFTELDSYRLDDVGEEELGVGKERYPGDIGDLWENDPERLLEYNLRDVELCVELDRKQEIVAFWNDARKLVGCRIEDAPTPGDAVDMYVLHEAHGRFALPSKGQQESEDFEGGAVFEPISGVREMLSVLDLKCFSADTELLTPDGPRNITEIEPGDPIYTLDPETFECEVVPVGETHAYDNRFGELHHLSGNTHDLKVTENHRLLFSKERGWDDQTPSDFSFAEYRDIPDAERFAFPQHEPMSGRSPETFDLVEELSDGHVVVYPEGDLRAFRSRVPDAVTDRLDCARGSSRAMGLQQTVGKCLLPVEVYREHRTAIDDHAEETLLTYGRGHAETPTSFAMENWLRLLGWYVTEGSIDHAGDRVVLHQRGDPGRGAIESLLDEMGIGYATDDRAMIVSDSHLLNWLEEHCGSGYADKRLPEWVFDLDADLLEPLLETMVDGDGSRTESGLRKFWTKSDQLKTAFVDLAVRCGHKPTVSKQSDGTWYVSAGKRGSFEKRTNATVEDHDGRVYCVTAADNHVVLAGRNGNFQWVGQSLYPMSMVTINASPETIVDPEEYDGDTYRTPPGVHFRKDQDGIIREMVDALLEEREDLKDRRDAAEPGSTDYERYDRQQSAVKVIMNCFTPDTEVLTPGGVRNVRDLDVGDEVYSLDPETERMEVKPVVETHEYPDYRGELVDIETSKIDFRVTPNHRMLVRKNDKNGVTEDSWGFVEAGNLYDYCHYEMPHGWSFDHADALDDTIDLVTLSTEVTDTSLAISDGGSKFAAKFGTPNIPREIDTGVFLRFLAWYITEGSVYRADNGNHRIKIAQEDTETRGQIESLVDEFTEYYYDNGRSIEFSSRVWADLLETLCGDSSGHKRIPDIVFQASEDQKQEFLNVLIKGDGDRQTNSWRYSTISDRLKDDLLRLCAHLGITASVNRDENTWRIYATENGKNSFRMYRSGKSSSAEDGVFCVSIKDNNTLLAGRNGKYNFVGNSLYGVFGWDRFRLYDREMSAAITATNREVISYTEEVANEMDYQVTYGDSVTGDRPVVVRDPGGRVRITPIETLFERATLGAEATALAADGGVATPDSGKDRGSLDGWEALSVSEDGDAEWQPIRRVIRHETDEPVVNLQHEFGESTTTRDHSYVVDDGDELVEAVPEDVTEPMRVPGLPEVETVDRIDVYEVLDGYTRAYEDGRSRGSENAETKVKHVHANDQYVWFGHSHHDALDSTVKVQRYVERGTESFDSLVRLLAAYVTEGSATTQETASSKFGASIAESRREWLEGLQEDYHRLFDNVETSVIRSDSSDRRRVDYETDEGPSSVTYDDATLKLQMMNELSAVFFREFAGQRSRGKRIPSFVFHLPEREQQLFLETLVEGDGSRAFPRYSEAYAERNFDFETVSRELAAGLSTLLSQRGENHSLKYREEKESYTIRTCDYYREGRDPVLTEVEHDGYVYDLDVAENDNFVDAVGGIVLHNTDSVMLEVGDDLDKPEAIDRSFELARRINQSYDEFARERLNAEDHRFEIEFEKLYRRFFQAGKKKRYAGHVVWKEGNDVDDLDIVGFEYQRSDIAPITKEVQREVLERIVRSEGEYRESVKEYVHDVIERFQNGEMSVEEVGIPGGIGKRLDNYDTDTAQVRGAKYANLLLGTNFGRGSKPKRLYLKRVHNDFYDRVERERGLDIQNDPLYREFRENEDVICVEYADQLPEEFEVDWEKMLDRTLRGPIERVLSAIDISWEEVKTGQEQTGLGSFV